MICMGIDTGVFNRVLFSIGNIRAMECPLCCTVTLIYRVVPDVMIYKYAYFTLDNHMLICVSTMPHGRNGRGTLICKIIILPLPLPDCRPYFPSLTTGIGEFFGSPYGFSISSPAMLPLIDSPPCWLPNFHDLCRPPLCRSPDIGCQSGRHCSLLLGPPPAPS